MSYILDALKRSEQERHQDKISDLSQDLLILQRKQQKKSIWPIVVACLLLVNAGGLFFLLYDGELTASDSNTIDKSVDTKIVNSTSGVQFENGSKLRETGLPNNAEVKSIPEHVQKKVVTERIASEDVFQGKFTKKPEEKAIYTQDGFELIAPKNTPKERIAKLKEGEAQSSAETILDDSKYEIIRPKNVRQETSQNTASDIAVPSPSRGVPKSYYDKLPHLTDLSLSIQKSVPDLTFNSHIYSDNPGARRVMINNLYMREGDAFSGLIIKSIGEQYIHLENDGGSFKLPVLRDWVSP